MARDHDANHVCAIGAANGAPRAAIAQTFRHPGIRARFADWDRPQNFPGSQLKIRADRRQRNIKPQLCRKIIIELLSRRREVPMLAWDYIRSQSLPQGR